MFPIKTTKNEKFQLPAYRNTLYPAGAHLIVYGEIEY